jgi:hypothetical protein
MEHRNHNTTTKTDEPQQSYNPLEIKLPREPYAQCVLADIQNA